MVAIRSWASNLGLWPRLALSFSLGFLVLFIVLLNLDERVLQESNDRILNERLIITQITARQIDSLLQQAVHELRELHSFTGFSILDLTSSIDIDTLDISKFVEEEEIEIAGFVYLTVDGKVALSHPSGLYAAGADLSGLPYVTQTLESREVTFSEPFHDPLGQEPVVAITIPIDEDGRFSGLLSGMVRLNGTAIMTTLQQAATIGATGHATLVDNQGRTLAATLPLSFLSSVEHPEFYNRALAQGEPSVETVPFEGEGVPGETAGERHVMALAPLTTVPWGVAVGGDEDETFAAVSRLRRGTILLASATLVTVWVLTLFGSRSMIRPIQYLTKSAQQIAQGKLQIPLQRLGYGEIGELVDALEDMRIQLLANIEQLADWNETLEMRVVAQTQRLQQLLGQIITAQEDERARLSRELHDEIGQMLAAVELSLERLAQSLPAEDSQAHERLERSRELTEMTISDLDRMVAALRPGTLDKLGLVSALGWMGDHVLHSQGVTMSMEISGIQERLPAEIETTLFRIAQEAMNNVVRHSQARHLELSLQREDSQVTMILQDDGHGFDPSGLSHDPGQSQSFGLDGMQERAALVGGKVEVISAPGHGATVKVVIPV